MFEQILNLRNFEFKNSFNTNINCIIIKVLLKNNEQKEFLIQQFGGYVHEWPLGKSISGIEATELLELLRCYEVHKAACESNMKIEIF